MSHELQIGLLITQMDRSRPEQASRMFYFIFIDVPPNKQSH
jgi:hypothetical protein